MLLMMNSNGKPWTVQKVFPFPKLLYIKAAVGSVWLRS